MTNDTKGDGMTLEQVRDELRSNAVEWRDCGFYHQADGLDGWVNAIDAHLAAQSAIRVDESGAPELRWVIGGQLHGHPTPSDLLDAIPDAEKRYGPMRVDGSNGEITKPKTNITPFIILDQIDSEEMLEAYVKECVNEACKDHSAAVSKAIQERLNKIEPPEYISEPFKGYWSAGAIKVMTEVGIILKHLKPETKDTK